MDLLTDTSKTKWLGNKFVIFSKSHFVAAIVGLIEVDINLAIICQKFRPTILISFIRQLAAIVKLFYANGVNYGLGFQSINCRLFLEMTFYHLSVKRILFMQGLWKFYTFLLGNNIS